jgi:hypothetical protein
MVGPSIQQQFNIASDLSADLPINAVLAVPTSGRQASVRIVRVRSKGGGTNTALGEKAKRRRNRIMVPIASNETIRGRTQPHEILGNVLVKGIPFFQTNTRPLINTVN